MKSVVFTKKGTANAVEYVKGDELNVSSSIFKDLTENQKCVKEKKSKVK